MEQAAFHSKLLPVGLGHAEDGVKPLENWTTALIAARTVTSEPLQGTNVVTTTFGLNGRDSHWHSASILWVVHTLVPFNIYIQGSTCFQYFD